MEYLTFRRFAGQLYGNIGKMQFFHIIDGFDLGCIPVKFPHRLVMFLRHNPHRTLTGKNILTGQIVQCRFGISEGKEFSLDFRNLCVLGGIFHSPIHVVATEKR